MNLRKCGDELHITKNVFTFTSNVSPTMTSNKYILKAATNGITRPYDTNTTTNDSLLMHFLHFVLRLGNRESKRIVTLSSTI